MKQLYKNSAVFLIFFLTFLFKENIYDLFIKSSNLDAIAQEITSIENNYYYEKYNKLLSEINLEIPPNYNYTYSKILYRDVYDFYDEITVLKGVKDNINNKGAVINHLGLVGVIKKVNKNSTVVTLITNKDSNVSIKINDAYGILVCENNRLIIKSINNYENIKIGDIVYTSGIASLPGGIKIGEVIGLQNDKLGIEQNIYVEPYVDFDDITYVAILNGV